MSNVKLLADKERINFSIQRLAHQVIENHQDLSQLYLVGIQRTGVWLADRIAKNIQDIAKIEIPKIGKLDVTFYRDDFRTRSQSIEAYHTEMPSIIEGRSILLIDDVLYTGRTIRAATDALLHYGRPEKVELLVLVDRFFGRHLPIQADYIGWEVDTLNNAYVRVDWAEDNKTDAIWLYTGERIKK